MNTKFLLGVVVVLTLTTAAVHFNFARGMLSRPFGAPGANGQPRPAGQTQSGGQPSTAGQPDNSGQPAAGGQPGSGNGQGNGGVPRNGANGGFRGPTGPFAIVFRYLPYLFILNGLGYLILLALVALPIAYFRDHITLTHWTLIGFAALTFVLYFVLNGFGGFFRNPSAIVAKTAEILLIVTTFVRLRALQLTAAPATPVSTTAAAS